MSVHQWFKNRIGKLDLLVAYFKAAYSQWHEILWGATVPAVIFFLWWSIGLPPTKAVVGWFVVALFLAGYYLWRTDHVRLIPRFRATGTQYKTTPIETILGVVDYKTFSQVVLRCSTAEPICECVGHLQRVERFTENNLWEETELDKGLILQWSNEKQRKIEQHQGAEKALNVFYIEHGSRLIVPCVNPDADIPPARLSSIFMRSSAGRITAFRFDIQITYSAIIDGKPIPIAAPERLSLEARFENDLFRPVLELKEQSSLAPATPGPAT
jgi:hypothetical protein